VVGVPDHLLARRPEKLECGIVRHQPAMILIFSRTPAQGPRRAAHRGTAVNRHWPNRAP
jgi:hypothetical protein